MNCEADMAIIPERNVDAALKVRSACPILPCWIGFGLSLPDFVSSKPALWTRSLSPTTDDGAVEVAFLTTIASCSQCC